MDKQKVCVVYSERYMEHETGNHVENPRRALAIKDALDAAPWGNKLVWVEPRAATASHLAMIHDREYIEYVEDTCRKVTGLYYLNPDTAVSHESYETALLAAGGVFTGIDRVLRKEESGFFALVRPPGHHAERNQSLGFCLFNNIALGARYAQEERGLDRVFILDWDVHHGNGTQHSFEDDASVFFASFHQFPHYPGTGRAEETGRGHGKGFTLNLPMPTGSTDDDYLLLMEEVVCAAIEKFKPQLLLVSAGFDAHRADPLGGILLSEYGYAEILDKAMETVECPIGLVLEGGYNLQTLASSAAAAVQTLCGEIEPALLEKSGNPSPNARRMADKTLKEHPFFTK